MYKYRTYFDRLWNNSVTAHPVRAVCICIYICIYTYTHRCIHIYTYIYKSDLLRSPLEQLNDRSSSARGRESSRFLSFSFSDRRQLLSAVTAMSYCSKFSKVSSTAIFCSTFSSGLACENVYLGRGRHSHVLCLKKVKCLPFSTAIVYIVHVELCWLLRVSTFSRESWSSRDCRRAVRMRMSFNSFSHALSFVVFPTAGEILSKKKVRFVVILYINISWQDDFGVCINVKICFLPSRWRSQRHAPLDSWTSVPWCATPAALHAQRSAARAGHSWPQSRLAEYVCIYIYVYMSIYIRVNIYIHSNMHLYAQLRCMCSALLLKQDTLRCKHICVCMYIYVYMSTWIYIHICIYMYQRRIIFVHVCVYVSILHTYTHIHL